MILLSRNWCRELSRGLGAFWVSGEVHYNSGGLTTWFYVAAWYVCDIILVAHKVGVQRKLNTPAPPPTDETVLDGRLASTPEGMYTIPPPPPL